MDWGDAGAIAAVSVVVGGILWALIETRGRRVFATTQDHATLERRFVESHKALKERNAELTALFNQTVGEVRELRTEQRHQWERLITPVEEVAEEIRELRRDFNSSQLDQAKLNERIDTTLQHVQSQLHQKGRTA